MNVIYGFLLGALIGLAALWLGALSPSGAAAAALTGGLIFGLGGVSWAVLLLTFFISSSALSKLFSNRKAAVNEKFAKGSHRDWGQVLANGGAGAVLALAYGFFPAQGWLWIAFAGAMAAVNADTWATELGVLSKRAPRLITTGQPADPGTSGAISLAGTVAAAGGALLIAVLAWGMAVLTGPDSGHPVIWIPLLTAAGLAGSLIDSLLGATVQAIYYCPLCQKETERHPLHLCGRHTVYRRGWRWLDNDLVNFACSVVGAGSAAGLWLLFR